MKCTRCDGNGKYKTIFGNTIICDFCYGTGEVTYGDDGIEPIGNKKPMTNEEWFCTLSTEEKAKFLFEHGVIVCCFCKRDCVEIDYKTKVCKYDVEPSYEYTGLIKWLKEKHERD